MFMLILPRKKWDVNSVGLECHLDRVEVTGSSPVHPTEFLATPCCVAFFIGLLDDGSESILGHSNQPFFRALLRGLIGSQA